MKLPAKIIKSIRRLHNYFFDRNHGFRIVDESSPFGAYIQRVLISYEKIRMTYHEASSE